MQHKYNMARLQRMRLLRTGKILAVCILCVLVFIVLLVTLKLIFSSGKESAKQPHILLIVADDYGWHDVGYHGSEISTPTLDRLAAEGVKLDNYYVQPICTPTRSQLLSGRYQIHTGLQHSIIWPDQPNGLPLQMPTIADRLRDSGYATHIVGKWHVGFYKKEYTPTYRGFDSFFGLLTGSADYYTHENCFDFPVNSTHNTEFCGLDLHENEKTIHDESQVYSTHLFTQRAQQIVEKHDPSKPLFLYLPYQAVHGPMQVPAKYSEAYSFIKDEDRRIYAGMTSCMDEGVANITDTFKNYGLWDNTVVIFSTDNGGQILRGGNNWPLRGWKGSLWEGGVRGVGFVSSPLLKQPKRTSKDLIHVTDWYPTLLGLAGQLVNQTGLDGHDMWPTISNGVPSPRLEILHNIDPLTPPIGESLYPDIFDTRIRAAVRVNQWKLITGDPGNGSWVPPPGALYWRPRVEDTQTSPAKNIWLFNILEDPEEKTDMSEQRPDIVKSLLRTLSYYNSTAVPVRYPLPDPNCNPALHGGAWVPWQ